MMLTLCSGLKGRPMSVLIGKKCHRRISIALFLNGIGEKFKIDIISIWDNSTNCFEKEINDIKEKMNRELVAVS